MQDFKLGGQKYKPKKKSKKENYCFLIRYNDIIYEKGNSVCVFDACVCYWVRAKLFCLKFFKRLSCFFWINLLIEFNFFSFTIGNFCY